MDLARPTTADVAPSLGAKPMAVCTDKVTFLDFSAEDIVRG